MPASAVLFAAEHATTEYHRFSRLHTMSEWWHWLALLAVCAGLLVYIVVMYYHDSVELTRGLSWSLVALRVVAFAGILFYFLDLEKRTEIRQIKNSRVMILVDTSQSMGLRDTRASNTDGPSRVETVIAELSDGELLTRLRSDHDLVLYRFDQDPTPVEIAAYGKTGAASVEDDASEKEAARRAAFQSARFLAMIAGIGALVALFSFAIYSFFGRRKQTAENTSWALLVAMVALIASVVIFAVANLRVPDAGIRAIVGLEDIKSDPDAGVAPNAEPDETPDPSPDVQWATELNPQGLTTRLGDAIRYLVNKERGGPIAGIVIFSDGGSNAGIDVAVAAAAARGAGIPLYTVGLGSDERPVNVQLVDLEAPKRIYPGDKFTVTGFVQASGMRGRRVKVELFSGPESTAENPSLEFHEDQRVELGEDGELIPVKFEVMPDEPGRRQFVMKVSPPQDDFDEKDNERSALVQIVERKNRVLLLAGGPSREYRFLRNLLFRDRETTLHVLLQSGTPGISQEADDVLSEFPQDADEMFEYDCIVAFDPDWMALDELQIELLDRWIAEKAGGLVVVAGPVYTPEWARFRRGRDVRIDKIRGIYPVVFYTQGAPTFNLGRFGGESSWPLAFTRDGMESEFLWLEDRSLDSEASWQTFDGVFGYYAVKDPKPGARIYARFSDPDTSIDGDLPIYMAGHFYGAGRVFFQASGEMWRLRAVEEKYFETYYTKLIRWVSQGRLLQDSSRGVLLVDKERCLLGDNVVLRAILSDAQYLPLTVDEVSSILIQPDGIQTALTFRRIQDAARDGMYSAQFTAVKPGDYKVRLIPPGSADGDLLTRDVRVRLPALEIERPERNDALLKELALKTGGDYFVGMSSAASVESSARTPLIKLIEPQDQQTYLPGTPDTAFAEKLMGWLMSVICGVLFLEWLIRRLSKLA